jgi:hypothetical protein
MLVLRLWWERHSNRKGLYDFEYPAVRCMMIILAPVEMTDERVSNQGKRLYDFGLSLIPKFGGVILFHPH